MSTNQPNPAPADESERKDFEEWAKSRINEVVDLSYGRHGDWYDWADTALLYSAWKAAWQHRAGMAQQQLRDLLDIVTGHGNKTPTLWNVEEAIRKALTP